MALACIHIKIYLLICEPESIFVYKLNANAISLTVLQEPPSSIANGGSLLLTLVLQLMSFAGVMAHETAHCVLIVSHAIPHQDILLEQPNIRSTVVLSTSQFQW